MSSKIIKLKKNPPGYTIKEKLWVMKRQQFIRAEFHDEYHTIRYYASINLHTMINGDPPGFTLGKRRYNIDLQKKRVDATNKVIYLSYTIGIPDPDIPEKGHLKRDYMDDWTYYTRMARQEAHNILTRGEEEEKIIKMLLIVIILEGIGLFFMFMSMSGGNGA